MSSVLESVLFFVSAVLLAANILGWYAAVTFRRRLTTREDAYSDALDIIQEQAREIEGLKNGAARRSLPVK